MIPFIGVRSWAERVAGSRIAIQPSPVIPDQQGLIRSPTGGLRFEVRPNPVCVHPHTTERPGHSSLLEQRSWSYKCLVDYKFPLASSFWISTGILVTCWFKLLEIQFKIGVPKVDQNQTSCIASVLPYSNLRPPLAFSLEAPKDNITDQRLAKG